MAWSSSERTAGDSRVRSSGASNPWARAKSPSASAEANATAISPYGVIGEGPPNLPSCANLPRQSGPHGPRGVPIDSFEKGRRADRVFGEPFDHEELEADDKPIEFRNG